MRIIGYFLLSTLWLSAYDYALIPKQVNQNVYCFFGKPEEITKENGGNMVNTCYISTKDGYVVVDAGPTFQYASQAYAAMQKIVASPVKYVITTHIHDDHWLGNSFYRKQGAVLIGPREYEQSIAGEESGIDPKQTRMAKIIEKETFEKTEVVPLDIMIDRQPYNFSLGGVNFEVKQLVKKAHTNGDLIVHIPSQKTVFTGDLVFNDRLTSLRDGSIIGSLQAIEALDALGAETIITGHGTVTDGHATAWLKAYLTEMKEKILEGLDEGIEMDKITDYVTMETYANDGLYQELHKRNVLDAYAELEMYDDEDE